MFSSVWHQTEINLLSAKKRSYIIYVFNSLGSRSPVVCDVGLLSLLYIQIPRRAEADSSRIDLLQGRLPLVCCEEKQCGLRRPACAWVCLSAGGREKLFSPILQWRAPGEASAQVGIRYISTGGYQTTARDWGEIKINEYAKSHRNEAEAFIPFFHA